jgi:hypothetical protein
MGRHLEARLGRPVLHLLPGGAHVALFSHWSEILNGHVDLGNRPSFLQTYPFSQLWPEPVFLLSKAG